MEYDFKQGYSTDEFKENGVVLFLEYNNGAWGDFAV